jgi:Sugar (pentulose and hexulose) kinases
MKRYAIGLDNGGTVIKAALFDMEGREIAVASRQTPVSAPRPGYAERDMEMLWLSNCECVREALAASGASAREVVGVAVCGHGKGLYAWGVNDEPARNGIVSTDNRAWQYPERWLAEGVFDRLYPRLCQRLIPCQQAALLAWLKDHERSSYDGIRWVFSVKDYIRFRLTGEAYSEATDLSGSGLMDVRGARVAPDILEDMGIGEISDHIPPLRYSADQCGRITREAAELTGLAEGTPVAGGMFDIDACAIAMAITKPEQLCTITGTWSINEFISPRPIVGSAIAMNSLYAIPGYYLLEECSATSAGNLEWFLRNCMGERRGSPDGDIYRRANELVASVDPRDCEVYYLPFLYGSNAHPLAKGSFVGLTTYHATAHLLRAVFEGVAYSHKTHVERLLSARKAPAAIRMAGGAANSSLWVQMFADVLGFPIETVDGVRELGALGSAMAAAVAAGVYPGYEEAAAAMVRVKAAVEPEPEATRVYAEKYAKYSAIVDALDGVWKMFAV